MKRKSFEKIPINNSEQHDSVEPRALKVWRIIAGTPLDSIRLLAFDLQVNISGCKLIKIHSSLMVFSTLCSNSNAVEPVFCLARCTTKMIDWTRLICIIYMLYIRNYPGNTTSSISSRLSSSICPWPPRCLVASWPRSPSAGTNVCSLWCCVSPATPRWSPNPLVASRPMILPSRPCVRSLEVGGRSFA